MKLFSLALMTVFLIAAVDHDGPVIVGGGGGTSEYYLMLGARNLKPLLQVCLATTECSAGVLPQLQTILAHPASGQIKFEFLDSKKMNEQKFNRISPFNYKINKDFLFHFQDGQTKPWLYDDAVDFIVDLLQLEFSFDPQVLSSLKFHLNKVALSFVSRSLFINKDQRNFVLSRLSAPVSALVIESAQDTESAAYEISFLTHLDCLNSSGVKTTLQNLTVDSAYWLTPGSQDYGSKLILRGQISYQCAQADGKLAHYRSQYQATLALSQSLSPKDWIAADQTEIIQSRIEDVF